MYIIATDRYCNVKRRIANNMEIHSGICVNQIHFEDIQELLFLCSHKNGLQRCKKTIIWIGIVNVFIRLLSMSFQDNLKFLSCVIELSVPTLWNIQITYVECLQYFPLTSSHHLCHGYHNTMLCGIEYEQSTPAQSQPSGPRTFSPPKSGREAQHTCRYVSTCTKVEIFMHNSISQNCNSLSF